MDSGKNDTIPAVEYSGSGNTFINYNHEHEVCTDYDGCPHTKWDQYPLLRMLEKYYHILQGEYKKSGNPSPDVLVGWLPNTLGPPGIQQNNAAWVVDYDPNRSKSESTLAHEVAHAGNVANAPHINTDFGCEAYILESGFDIYSGMAIPGIPIHGQFNGYRDVMASVPANWILPCMWEYMIKGRS